MSTTENVTKAAMNYVIAEYPGESPALLAMYDEGSVVTVLICGNNQNYHVGINEELDVVKCIVAL